MRTPGIVALPNPIRVGIERAERRYRDATREILREVWRAEEGLTTPADALAAIGRIAARELREGG